MDIFTPLLIIAGIAALCLFWTVVVHVGGGALILAAQRLGRMSYQAKLTLALLAFFGFMALLLVGGAA